MEINNFSDIPIQKEELDPSTNNPSNTKEIEALFDKIISDDLTSKSLRMKNVKDLSNKIKNIELKFDQFKNLKIKIQKIKNIFFKQKNSDLIEKQRMKLNEEKHEYERSLELISTKSEVVNLVKELDDSVDPEKISKIEKTIKSTLKGNVKFRAINEKIKVLILQAKQNFFSNALKEISQDLKKGDFDNVFGTEHRLRVLIEGDFLNKELFQNPFEEQILPLIRLAKEAIVNKPIHLAAQAAASKGEAALAGFNTIKNLAENKPFIKASDISSQEVFLLPKEHTVFKMAEEKAKEEEQIINYLMDLCLPDAIVGSFDIKNPTLDRYGIQISEKALERGFSSDDLPPKLLREIRAKLSSESGRFYNKHLSSTSDSTLYLSPDLSDEANKMAYEICEKFKWIYQAKDGSNKIVDFKTLHARDLENELMLDVKPILSEGENEPSQSVLKKALNVPWKAMSPEIMQDEVGKLKPLHDIQSKRFISEMIILDNLSLKAREVALERLTDRDQAIAVLTSEFQLLDLHQNNLGVAPVPNPFYEYFKEFSFFFSGKGPLTFNKLISDYLNGKIESSTEISFNDNGENVKKQLKDLPNLQQALDIQWKLVVFDTDLSLAEDNRLQLQIRYTVQEHLIPLRSVLLETSWKDRPLSQKAIELINSDERDKRVVDWISNEHSPIYKRLSSKTGETIKHQILPLLSTFELSGPLKNEEKVTIKKLKIKFCTEFADISVASHVKIWEAIEKDLSSVFIRKGDTWESLARRHHQEVNVIKALNKNTLPESGSIKIKYDLTSNTTQAIKQRQKIAAQLFPPITIRQKEALLERLQNRKNYLINYNTLTISSSKGIGLLDQIENFIQHPSTPLSSIRKETLLALINTQRNECLKNPTASEDLISSIEDLKRDLCKECQPTYFNLTKSMYPLLADAYTLNQAVYKSNAEAGKCIGFFDMPLEKTIDSAKKKFSSDSQEYKLALLLEKKILSISNPSFFGYWD